MMGHTAIGKPANVTIPSNISPGGYLLRSELISLQNAMSPGGAEFYPACIQLSIGGSGTGTATGSEECTLPGCYSDSDPGILDPNVSVPGLLLLEQTLRTVTGLRPTYHLHLPRSRCGCLRGYRWERRWYSTQWYYQWLFCHITDAIVFIHDPSFR
jgi:hypothetical protein